MLHTEPSNSGIFLLAIMEASVDSFGTLAERLDGNRGTVMKDEYHNKNIMDAVEVMYKTKANVFGVPAGDIAAILLIVNLLLLMPLLEPHSLKC